jgi:hypothetical protein
VHLRRVRTLVDIVDPVLVSGHLAWSTHDGEYLNDLLPLPYDEETLRLVAARITAHAEAQQRGDSRFHFVLRDISRGAWSSLIKRLTRIAGAVTPRLSASRASIVRLRIANFT